MFLDGWWKVHGPWFFGTPNCPKSHGSSSGPVPGCCMRFPRLPHRSGDTTAGTLQLHWASKDAMLGPVEKGRKREMVSAGGGEKKGCLKGEIHWVEFPCWLCQVSIGRWCDQTTTGYLRLHMTPWKQEKHRLNLSMSNRGLQMGFVILNDFDICSDMFWCY